ncbi:MAG: hypothetical protein L0H83_03480 [Salinisphaera sp.]|nr:hypothetical protein [Salinisphaera sp.]
MHLIQHKTNRRYAFCPLLAKRPDMIVIHDDQKPEKEPNPPEAADSSGQGDFVITTATKAELIAFAKENYGVKLDKQKRVSDLRSEVFHLG